MTGETARVEAKSFDQVNLASVPRVPVGKDTRRSSKVLPPPEYVWMRLLPTRKDWIMSGKNPPRTASSRAAAAAGWEGHPRPGVHSAGCLAEAGPQLVPAPLGPWPVRA